MTDTTVIGFHLPTEEYGCMSNWYPAEFTYAGQRYCSVQQYMMYHKVMLAGRYDLAKEIMRTDDPAAMDDLAGDRTFPEFTRIKNKWHWICRIVVRRAVFAKFIQHPDLRKELLSTGNAILAECSPLDKTWGVGIGLRDTRWKHPENWNGKNELGTILMEVRDEIRQLEMVVGEENLRFEDALHSETNDEWSMSAAALANHPSYSRSVMAYVDTFANNFARQSFMDSGMSLADWEKKIRANEGASVPVLGFFDLKQDVYDISRRLYANVRYDRIHAFCSKYMIFLEMFVRDEGLRAWANGYQKKRPDEEHTGLIKIIYDEFTPEARKAGLMPADYYEIIDKSALDVRMISNRDESWIQGLARKEVLACVAWHFRADYFAEGALIRHSIGDGVLLKLFKALL